MTTRDWKDAALRAHNELRAKHGAAPLQWCEECYAAAKRQADACSSKRSLFHGNTDGPSGRHGQNVFWGSSGRNTVKEAVDSWYSEVTGYNFGRPGFHPSAGHFTQVVWTDTEKVGVAVSADGCFISANYFPAGNMMPAENFSANVFPLGSRTKPRQQTAATQGRSGVATPGPSWGPPGIAGTPQGTTMSTYPPAQVGDRVVAVLNGQRLAGTVQHCRPGGYCEVQLDKDPVGTLTILPGSSLESEPRSCLSRLCSCFSGRKPGPPQESQGLMMTQAMPQPSTMQPQQVQMVFRIGTRVQVPHLMRAGVVRAIDGFWLHVQLDGQPQGTVTSLEMHAVRTI